MQTLRERGRAVPVTELARELLALSGSVEVDLARRLVAAALGRPADAVGDEVPASWLIPPEPRPDPAIPLDQAEFAVVDLETTGLSAGSSRIIEIGAVRVAGLRRVDCFATLVAPGVPVPRAITNLTGIDDSMLATAPASRSALVRFRRWLDGALPAPFVAHNATFDAGFVRRELIREGLPPLAAPVLCTRRLAVRLLPDQRRSSLDALSQRFRIHNRARHRALGDAEAAAELLIRLVRRAREAGLTTLGELLEVCALPPRRARRRLRPDGPPPSSAGPRGAPSAPRGGQGPPSGRSAPPTVAST